MPSPCNRQPGSEVFVEGRSYEVIQPLKDRGLLSTPLTCAYLCEDHETGQKVVVKEILHQILCTRMRQAKVLLDEHDTHLHPAGFPRIHTLSDQHQVSEYVPGIDLHAYVTGGRSLSIPDLSHLLVGGIERLDTLHECDLVHCDIRPDNVVVLQKNNPLHAPNLVPIDFDFAQRSGTESGLIFCTKWMCAPERFSWTVSPAADVFSWGMSLFDVLNRTYGLNELTYCARTALIDSPFDSICHARRNGTWLMDDARQAVERHLAGKLFERGAGSDEAKLLPRFLDAVFACVAQKPEARPRSAHQVKQILGL